jgi:hypothetical protein
MGIKEEVFEGFFKKLEQDEDFPNLIIEELRKLWESGELRSQEKIFEAIRKGCRYVRED